MQYQIGQSIKIEDTSKTTYVCLSNDTIFVSSISATEKRLLKRYFRQLQKPLIFKLFTFSVLCARTLLENMPQAVDIDREYDRHERHIKSFIVQIIRIERKLEPVIHFTEIGKSAHAHTYVYQAMKSGKKDRVISAQEVIRYYEKIQKSQKRPGV